MLYKTELGMLAKDKHSSLLVPFVSLKNIEVDLNTGSGMMLRSGHMNLAWLR